MTVSEGWFNAVIPSPRFLAFLPLLPLSFPGGSCISAAFHVQTRRSGVTQRFGWRGRSVQDLGLALVSTPKCCDSLASLKPWSLTDLFFSTFLNRKLLIWIYIRWNEIKQFARTLNRIDLQQRVVCKHEHKCFSLYFHFV